MEKLRLHPEARIELIATIAHYEEIIEGLGLDFERRFITAAKAIKADPEQLRERTDGYRRHNFTRFPYYLPYLIRGETIWILAVAHGHRKPEYWAKRIDDLKPS